MDDVVYEEGSVAEEPEDDNFTAGAEEAPAEPAQPDEPAQPAAPAALPAWAQPIVAGLPAKWQTRIAGGEDPGRAISQHYRGIERQAAQQRRSAEAANQKVEKMLSRLSETLGIDLADKEEPPPEPAVAIERKVDQVLEMQQERELDYQVDQVDAYARRGEAEILREEPEYHQAVSFWTERQLGSEVQALNQALFHYNMTKNPESLHLFPQHLLRAFEDGDPRIPDFESLVRFSAGYRVQRMAADAMTIAAQQGGNASRAALQAARAMGWRPSLEQNGNNGHQPAPAAAAPRPDPRVERVRRNTVPTPRPSGGPGGPLDAKTLLDRVANMTMAEYDAMLDDAFADGGPAAEERLKRQLRDLAAS